MLIRVLACAHPCVSRERLQRLFNGFDGVYIEPNGTDAPIGPDKLARVDADLVFLSRSSVPGPLDAAVESIKESDRAPELVLFDANSNSEERARWLAAGGLSVLDPNLPDAVLRDAIAELVERTRRLRSNPAPSGWNAGSPRLADFESRSPAMREFLSIASRVARSDSTVLLVGETGVGKERLARAIHAEGPRAEKAFVAVNCGALPESLLESELFGHVRGAFTGAVSSRRGWFELAHGGTLLLDEIVEMPLHSQTRLLRVLQDRVVVPLGGEHPRVVDVRIVSATNGNLEQRVAAREFRSDLYYRLGVIVLEVPPLRRRREDIPLLVERYVQHFRSQIPTDVERFSADAVAAMTTYDWPGNLRELVNVVERSLLLANGPEVHPADLPRTIREGSTDAPRDDSRPQGLTNGTAATDADDTELASSTWREARSRLLEAFERRYLTAMLRATHGRIDESARRAGMTPRNLFDKLRHHGLDKADFRVSGGA